MRRSLFVALRSNCREEGEEKGGDELRKGLDKINESLQGRKQTPIQRRPGGRGEKRGGNGKTDAR